MMETRIFLIQMNKFQQPDIWTCIPMMKIQQNEHFTDFWESNTLWR